MVEDDKMEWSYRYGAFGNLEQKRLLKSHFGDNDSNYHNWEYTLTGVDGAHAIYNGVQHHDGSERKVSLFVEKYLVNGGSVAIDRDNNRTYYVSDNMGNVRAVIRDSVGGDRGYEHYDQTPFGDSTLTYSGLGSRFSYGAKEMNPENGYFAMGARLYDLTGMAPEKEF
jgi:hypothetical protein